MPKIDGCACVRAWGIFNGIMANSIKGTGAYEAVVHWFNLSVKVKCKYFEL